MDITSLIIEAVSGAVGGNVAGAALKDKSLGAIGNSIAGIVGGGVGQKLFRFIKRVYGQSIGCEQILHRSKDG